MKRLWIAILPLFLLLAACQSSGVPVTIFADGQVHTLNSSERVPAKMLEAAGVSLGAQDRIYYLGSPTPADVALREADGYTLSVQRAVEVTLVTPDGSRLITSSALSVGQLLTESGVPLIVADRVDPPIETPLFAGLVITYQPAAALVITVDGAQKQGRSSADTVGEALADNGIPLIGLDYSVPDESSPLPADGQIRVVRVVESVVLTQKTLPFTSRTEASADLELDQQEMLQAGEPGLAVSRARVRMEDGAEISRQEEGETIVRPAQDRVVGFGTRVEIRTAVVDGVTISYWRAVQVYATSYSPCRSGVSSCLYYTSSRQRVQKGVIAVASRWYSYMAGTSVFVPGYGSATVEDIGGGFPDRYWIDLAYSDEDFVAWGDYVTLYFLTPVPANILYILPYR